MLILVAVVLMTIPMALGIRERRRLDARLNTVSKQHRELQAVLNGFMEESEKIAAQLSRLISANRLSIASHSPESASSGPSADSAGFKSNGLDKKRLVLGLARKNHKVEEIAERLMIPKGEVELILNLSPEKRGAVRTSA